MAVLGTVQMGYFYVGVRLFYPLVFKRGLLVTLVTVPNYAAIGLLIWSVAKKML